MKLLKKIVAGIVDYVKWLLDGYKDLMEKSEEYKFRTR